jgi:hypothetical protein
VSPWTTQQLGVAEQREQRFGDEPRMNLRVCDSRAAELDQVEALDPETCGIEERMLSRENDARPYPARGERLCYRCQLDRLGTRPDEDCNAAAVQLSP